jgi:hypothetical protein
MFLDTASIRMLVLGCFQHNPLKKTKQLARFGADMLYFPWMKLFGQTRQMTFLLVAGTGS